MTALTAGKAVKTRLGLDIAPPVKAATKIQAGAIVVMDGTVAVPGRAALGLKCIGFAEAEADNTAGADGAVAVRVRRGVPLLCVNSTAADAITPAHINATAYLVDDQTVALTSGANTRSAAGRITDVSVDGVWVLLGEPAMPAA